MKKNLFYLFAMLCSMSLFVACSDDDDKMPNLPTEAITPESGNLTVSINGTATTTGSAKFEVQNASEAILTLTNVIPGYASVAVDVELEATSNGSYKFAGETGLTTPPSMGATLTKANYVPVIMNVAVQGTVTADGKASVTATTTLSEAAQGGLTGSWNISLEVVQDEHYYTTDAAIVLDWKSSDPSAPIPSLASQMVSNLGSSILVEFLNSVTFNIDGNITAQYSDEVPALLAEGGIMGWLGSTPNAVVDDSWNLIGFKPLNTSWKSSPKNLIFWYTQGEYIYLIPNIEAILKQVSADQGTDITGSFDMAAIIAMLGELGIDLNDSAVQALLPQVMGWLSTGIPLRYTETDGILHIYVNQEMAAPFINILLPILGKIEIPEEYTGLLALIGITDLQEAVTQAWESTTTFELGLMLKK